MRPVLLPIALLALTGCIRVFAPPVSSVDGGVARPAPTPPVFGAFSPTRAFAGDTLDLQATHLDAQAGAITVLFPSGQPVVASDATADGHMQVVVPESAGSGSLALLNAVGRSNALDGFVYRGFGQPRLVAAPEFRTVVPKVRGLWAQEDDALAWWAELGILHSWRHGPVVAPLDTTVNTDPARQRNPSLELLAGYAFRIGATSFSAYAGNPPDFTRVIATCPRGNPNRSHDLAQQAGMPVLWECIGDALVATNPLTCEEMTRHVVPDCGTVLGAFDGGACAVVDLFGATQGVRCADATWGVSPLLPGDVLVGTATRLADGSVAGALRDSDTNANAPFRRMSAFTWDGTSITWTFQGVELPSRGPVADVAVDGQDRATAGVFVLQAETDLLTRMELVTGRVTWGASTPSPAMVARMPSTGTSAIRGALVVAGSTDNVLALRDANTSLSLGALPLELGLGGAGGSYVGSGDGVRTSGFRVCSSGTGVVVRLDENGTPLGYEPSGALPGVLAGCAFPPAGPVLLARRGEANDQVLFRGNVVGELPVRTGSIVNTSRLVVDAMGNTWMASGAALGVVRADGSFSLATSAVEGASSFRCAAPAETSGVLIAWTVRISEPGVIPEVVVSVVEHVDLDADTGEPVSLRQRQVEARVSFVASMRDGVHVLTVQDNALEPQAHQALWNAAFEDILPPVPAEFPLSGLSVPGQWAVSPDGRFLVVVPAQVFDVRVLRLNVAGLLEPRGLYPLERGVLGLAFSDSGETLMAVTAAHQTVRRERDQVVLFR